MELNIKIPAAFESLFTPARGHVFHGGRGAGKSETVGRYLLGEGLKEPMNIVCGREFQTSIKESVHSMLAYLIEQEKLTSAYDVFDTEIRGKNGTQFTFIGLKRNISSMKSMHNIKRFWGEEAQVLSAQSLDVLFPTIRAEGSELIFTMNPEYEEDPAYQMLVVNPPDDYIVKKVNYPENPYFPDVLRKEMEAMKKSDYQKYLHIWEGKPKASVEGAIYAQELQKARDEGRIGKVPYDDRYPVSTFWDLGWADNTSIWFLQTINHEFRVIDCYQSQFQKTPHYVQVLQERGYRYDRIVLPHDAEAEHANADRTWMQIVRQSFPNANVYAGIRQPIEVRLEATKNMFGQLSISDKCKDGLAALARYHYATDETTGRITREPFHGQESNYADAFGYLCLEMIAPTKQRRPKSRPSIIRRSGIR